MRATTVLSSSCSRAVQRLATSMVHLAAPQSRPCVLAVASSPAVQPCEPLCLHAITYGTRAQNRFSTTIARAFAPEADYQTEEQEPDYFKSGDVVDGIVDGIRPFGAFIKLNGTEASGLLHISNISSEYIDNVDAVLEVGEKVKVLITRVDREDGRISLTTKRLERNPGDMINNRQAVWDGAEEMAQAVRAEWAERRAERRDSRGEGDRDSFRGRPRRDDDDGFRGRGGRGGGGFRGRGGGRGGRGGYNRDGGERRQRRDYE